MKYFYLLVPFLFFGCVSSKSTYQELPTINSAEKVSYRMERVALGDYPADSFHYKYTTNYTENGQDYWFVANGKTRRLEGYNLQQKKRVVNIPFSKIIDLDKNGDLNSFHVHNLDSIFIAQEYLLTLLDTTGVQQTLAINPQIKNSWPKHYLKNLHDAPIYFDPTIQKVISTVYCGACYQHKPDYYTTSIEAAIDMNTEKITTFPITYPAKFIDNYYGFTNQISKTIRGDSSIYSFSIDPNIYIFNRKTNEIRTFGGRSSYQKEEIRTLDKKDKSDGDVQFRHWILSAYYGHIDYDPYRKLYYRFFMPGLPDKNEEGLYNGINDKQLILMVFDENLELLDEIDLGVGKYFRYHSFVTKDGLHLPNTKEKKEYFSFDIFQFERQ